MDNSASAEAAHWHNGQPARRLASYVQPMQAALRISALEAELALWLPLMAEAYESLLVLHPVRPVELIADYSFKLTADNRINKDTGILRRRQPERIGFAHAYPPLLVPQRRPVVPWVADELTQFWLNRDAATTPIDSPPGLPPGAVLGVLEADAARLWPELGMAPSATGAAPELSEVLKERKPGDVWTVDQQDALLDYVERRKVAEPRLKVYALHDDLGATFKCSASNIRGRLADARKRKYPEQSGSLKVRQSA